MVSSVDLLRLTSRKVWTFLCHKYIEVEGRWMIMYDPKIIIEKRQLKEPISVTDPALFPRNEYVPEGCKVLEGLKDDWGYPIKVHPAVRYVEREGMFAHKAPDLLPLHLTILEPRLLESASKIERERLCQWPCVVYIQGSAFHKQDVWSNLPRHLRLAQKGYVIAVVQYRPSEVSPFPAQAEDAKTAVRFMRMNAKKYHIDPERIALAGDSSGAHTALIAGFSADNPPDTSMYYDYSAKVRCIVTSYAPTVFSLMNYCDSSQNHYDEDSPEGYEIGYKNVLDHPELVRATIPMNYLSENQPTPSLLMFHGGRDWLVNFDQAVQLYEYMKKLGKDVTFYKINDASHGFLGFENDTVLNIVDDYLKKHL